MEFRIGINLGEVIGGRDRIYGDGVRYGSPNFVPARYSLAAIYASPGREMKVRAEVEDVYRLCPKFSLGHITKVFPFSNK